MNKKAIFDDVVDFILTVITLFFIFLFVNFYLGWLNDNKAEQANQDILQIQADQFLLVYARTPVQVRNEQRLMAELAADPLLQDTNSDEHKAFATANKQFFDNLFSSSIPFALGACDTSIIIKKDSKERTLANNVRGSSQCQEPLSHYEIIVPDENGSPITLEIIFKKLISRAA